LTGKAKERPFSSIVLLSKPLEKTFEKRNTLLNPDAALFDPSFGRSGDRNAQWQSFIEKTRRINAPESFEEIMGAVKLFLEPLATSIFERRAFNSIWTAPGPWR
jgi:hypothetical protein